MKLAYVSPIFLSSDPAGAGAFASPAMSSAVRFAVSSSRTLDEPHADRSAGISAFFSQVPFA